MEGDRFRQISIKIQNLFPENSSGGIGRFYKDKSSCPEIFNARLRY